MNKIILTLLIIVAALAAAGFYLYRVAMPSIVADAVLSESTPGFIPKRLQTRVEAMKKPINKGTEAMIEKMHDSQIPLSEVLEAVDDITEEQANSFLDDVTTSKPASSDEVFDLAKKHFRTDFDPEVFREPFNKHFRMDQIRTAIAYADGNRKSNDIDLATAKAIIKRIIVEKEREITKAK